MNLISSVSRLRIRSESSSSLNSATSAPGSVFSGPSSPASTTATSVLEDDDFDNIQNLYIRKDAGIEPSIRQAYQSVLLPLLNQELVHSAYAERYSITLCSVGFQKSAFCPAILISTPTPKAKKKIFAHLAGLKELELALKEHNLALHVVVHRVRRSGGRTAQLADIGKLAYVVPRPGSNALCGSKIFIPKSGGKEMSSCTSGPTFTVGGRECGKTALHPWEDSDNALSEADSESSVNDEEDDETDDGLALSMFPNSIGVLKESDDSSSLLPDSNIRALKSLPQTGQVASYMTNKPRDANEDAQSTHHRPSRVNPLYQGPQTDWLLYDAQEAGPDYALSELARNEVDGYKITKFHHEDPDAKVPVAIADHEAVVHGDIQPGTVFFRSGPRTYDLRLVILDRPLRPGCSGAAVTHRGELCGTIQVISEDVPWAYMVPIEAELKEMEAVCGLPIRLSCAEEEDVVELDSQQSFASTPPEMSAADSALDCTYCDISKASNDYLDYKIDLATEARRLNDIAAHGFSPRSLQMTSDSVLPQLGIFDPEHHDIDQFRHLRHYSPTDPFGSTLSSNTDSSVSDFALSPDVVRSSRDLPLAYSTQDPSLIHAPRPYGDAGFHEQGLFAPSLHLFTSTSPSGSPAPSPQPYGVYHTTQFSDPLTNTNYYQQPHLMSRRQSLASYVSGVSHPSPASHLDEQSSGKGRCPHPHCGKVFKDLQAHMLTHQAERPEKCPILTCEYNLKGFARKYDKNRHTLAHYKGTMVCGFCPGSGSPAEKSFNRADVFKRHLTSVHGVEQTPPNSRKRSPSANNRKLSSYCQDATGKCSTCSVTFNNAQDFYDHLDDCVLRVVQQEEPSEAVNVQHLSHVNNDHNVQETLDRYMIKTEDAPTSFDDEEEDNEDDEEEDNEDDEENDDEDEDPSFYSRSGKGTLKSHKHPASARAIIGGGISKPGKSSKKAMTWSKGGVALVGKGRKKRKHYPPSWSMATEKMGMKKRVLCIYDGERRLWKDDMMLHNEFEVRMTLPDGKNYVTDLDVETLKRAEAFHNATDEEKGPWMPSAEGEGHAFDLNALMA